MTKINERSPKAGFVKALWTVTTLPLTIRFQACTELNALSFVR